MTVKDGKHGQQMIESGKKMAKIGHQVAALARVGTGDAAEGMNIKTLHQRVSSGCICYSCVSPKLNTEALMSLRNDEDHQRLVGQSREGEFAVHLKKQRRNNHAVIEVRDRGHNQWQRQRNVQ